MEHDAGVLCEVCHSLSSMPYSEAVIRSIPRQTSSEQQDADKSQLEAIFAGDDIAGLELGFGRHRKMKADSIEEYLLHIGYSSSEDGENDIVTSPSPSGIFKTNYKMKIEDSAEKLNDKEISVDISDQSSPLRKPKISSASTKSEIKNPENSVKPIFVMQKTNSSCHIVKMLEEFSLPLVTLGFIKSDGSLTLSESSEAKIFKTRNSISRVSSTAQACSVIYDSQQTFKAALDLADIGNYNSQTNHNSTSALRLSGYIGGHVDSLFTVKDENSDICESISDKESMVYLSLSFENAQTVILEFHSDPELLNHQTLRAIYVCHLPGQRDKYFTSKLLEKLNSPAKQEGYTTMKKFISSIFDGSRTSRGYHTRIPQGLHPTLKPNWPSDFDNQDFQLCSLKVSRRKTSSCQPGDTTHLNLSPRINQKEFGGSLDECHENDKDLNDFDFSL